MNDNLLLTEEVFCLKFELDILASALIKNETERWVPGFMHEAIEKDHTDRYIWASNYVAGKKVLDIACGAGKGSYVLATKGNAASVTGGDLSADAVRYAKHRYADPRVRFTEQDALQLPWHDEFDVIVSFETIEHVPDVAIFLNKIAGALKKDGLFLVSSPISAIPLDKKPDNPFHVQEWGFESFQKLLSDYLVVEEVYIQLYPPTPVQEPPTLWNRIKRKLKGPPPRTTRTTKGSTIEKFSGQYPPTEIGTTRVGYQIAVCRKG